jgi:hypothetical protein
MYVILCLGVAVHTYGPFSDIENAREFLRKHAPLDEYCGNSVYDDDHSIEQMRLIVNGEVVSFCPDILAHP